MKKSFIIDPLDSTIYPTAELICEHVEKYAVDAKGKLEWVNKDNTVAFYLDGALYKAERRIERGGYTLYFHEM